MSTPESGKMPWAQALTGPLAEVTCLWQDLDGLHVEPAPAAPPPASMMWGWRDRDYLVRLRLDGDTAFIAVCDMADADGQGHSSSRTLPWSLDDHRIAASRGRGPSADDGGVGAVYEQIVVDGIGDQAGPITFLRPAGPHDGGQPAGDHAGS